MPRLADSFVSSVSRPLRLCMRPDLDARQQEYLGRSYWVVKDPIALKYYRFEEEEYALLKMLDGRSSMEQIQRRFQRKYAPQKLSLKELHRFVGMMHRSSLVLSDAPGQGPRLLERGREQTRKKVAAAASNILCLRFKGIDPDRILTWLNQRIGWFFSAPAVFIGLAFALSALLLVGVEFENFRTRLPAFREFFGVNNWMWLSVALASSKVLHEFGHGLSCKRFGGECHEMGLMLLVLTPCLYCNVSDSWMLKSKWRRAGIGAAGMYVEIILASICTYLWWFSKPGMLNYLCLNLMFVSSVSTLMFNANPLLRYDGYYILSDLIEIPNLRQKAGTILQRKLAAWFLGMPEAHDPFLPQRRQFLFALYSIAAAAYKWVVALSILWFLYQVFEPYGLQIVGQMLACASLFSLLIYPLFKMVKFFYVPGRIDQVKKPRMLGSLAAASIVILVLFFLPFPYYVSCSLHVQLRDASSIYVDIPGSLREIHVRPGSQVRQDQPLATLENIDVELTIAQLIGQREQLIIKLNNLRLRAVSDDEAAARISEAAESLASLEQRLKKRRRDLQALTLVAPATGVVYVSTRPPAESKDSGRLPTWSGIPLKDDNLGAFFQEGDLICRVGQPGRFEAILAIDQSDIEFVQPGQRVDLFLQPLPGKQFTSKIESVSELNMKMAPSSLSNKMGGQLATRTDAMGVERPLEITYQASSPLEDSEGLILLGASGQAKIHAGSQTIARRAWRRLCRTFHFEL